MSPGFWDKLKSAFSGSQVEPPGEASSGPFQMKIEEVFSITGRGTVVTGTVAAGSVRIGDVLVLRSAAGTTKPCRVTGIEKFRKLLDAASAGDNVGILLADVQKNDVARGDSLSNV